MLLPALCLGIASFASVQVQEFPAPTYFIFLVTGKNPPKATPEEIQKYQAAHIDNFKRLFGERKLITAGPCADPEKTKRGIVILTVKNEKEILECFKPDPYVEKGFMEVQAIKMKVEFGSINTSGIDPNGIEENRIVLFRRDPLAKGALPTKLDKASLEYLNSSGAAAGLSFYATMARTAPIDAVALFKGKDDAKIQAWVDQSPWIRNGVVKATKFPQYLSKGVLP